MPLIELDKPAKAIIEKLKQKTIYVPAWPTIGNERGLEAEYNPKLHPVMDLQTYRDGRNADGSPDRMTRVTYNLQQLAVKRMTELCCGIPVKRVYKPENERQKEVANYMEKIFLRNRIDSVNNDRLTMLFASCEVMTLWYGVEKDNNLYGFKSHLKLRCQNISPMNGDNLYPLFDEYGDLIALSVLKTRTVEGKSTTYFDCYTEEKHYKWADDGSGNGWQLIEEDDITQVGKIPAVYMYRPTPIWEDTSNIVYEMEWSMSRNGNYLRKNSKPLFCVFADEEIRFGDENDNENSEFRSVLQYPKGSTAGYVTWQQAVENLKFHITELRQSFFTQLQLPDWSYESMKANPMSGESRKQLFIDAQLKVKDESGRLIEFFDREVNVIKAFMKIMLDDSYAADIDALPVENEVTPFTITEEKDTISNLMLANGNKPMVSQRESIEMLGWTDNVDKTLEEIQQDSALDAFSLTE